MRSKGVVSSSFVSALSIFEHVGRLLWSLVKSWQKRGVGGAFAIYQGILDDPWPGSAPFGCVPFPWVKSPRNSIDVVDSKCLVLINDPCYKEKGQRGTGSLVHSGQ